MSHRTAYETLRTHLEANLAGTLRFTNDGADPPQPADEEDPQVWCLINISPQASENTALGGRRVQRAGFVEVVVYATENFGELPALDKCDEITTVLENQSIRLTGGTLSVDCLAASTRRIGNVGSWLQYAVRTPYQFRITTP